MKRKLLNWHLLMPLLMFPLYADGDGDAGGGANANANAEPVDVNAIANAAVAKAQAEWQASLKATTGFDTLEAFNAAKLETEGKHKEIADAATKKVTELTAQLQQTTIKQALLAASNEALYPDIIVELLSAKAVVDTAGTVSIDGKPVKEAVATFLKDKPNLAKPTGNTGSGSQTQTTLPAAGEQAKQHYAEAAKKGDVLTMLNLNTGVEK